MGEKIKHDLDAARRRGGASTKARSAKKVDSYLRKVNIREEVEREERERRRCKW